MRSGKRRRVAFDVLTLADDGPVPSQAVAFQGGENPGLGIRYHPWRVEIVDTNGPMATMSARIEPGRDCRQERAQVQRSGRRGREPTPIDTGVGLF